MGISPHVQNLLKCNGYDSNKPSDMIYHFLNFIICKIATTILFLDNLANFFGLHAKHSNPRGPVTINNHKNNYL